MIRAVIDTNVLVSAMISSGGNEALLLMAVNQGLVAPYLSPEILTEYREVLIRPRFSFSMGDIESLLELLRCRGSLHDPVPPVHLSPDPDDNKFIACALKSNADFLVTGNKRHFPHAQVKEVKVVNASELLEFITQGL